MTPIRTSPQTLRSIFIHSGKGPGSETMTAMATTMTHEMIRTRRYALREPWAARTVQANVSKALAMTMLPRIQTAAFTTAASLRDTTMVTRVSTLIPR
jgi:hypothetical protein